MGVLARAFLLILPDAGRTPAGAEVGRGDAAEGGGFSRGAPTVERFPCSGELQDVVVF